MKQKKNKTLFITNTFQNPPSIDTNFRPPNVQYILQFIRLRVQFSCTLYILGVILVSFSLWNLLITNEKIREEQRIPL